MAALILERLAGFNPRADNVAVTDLKVRFSVVQRFRLHSAHALFEDAHLFEPVEIVEHNASVTPYYHDLPRLVRVRPADLNMAENVVRIAERDETQVLTTIAQDLAAYSAHPFRDAAQQVVEDGNIVRSEVPDRVHIAANRTQVGSAGVDIIDSPLTGLVILLNLSNACVEDKRVADHQDRRLCLGQGNEFIGVGHSCSERLFNQNMFPFPQENTSDVVVRRSQRAYDHRVDVSTRCDFFGLRGQIHTGKSPCQFL
jgi:hypothetical protein